MNLLSKLKSLIAFMTVAYVIGLAIWFVLWLTVKDGYWLLVLINRFVPYLLIPLPILLALNLPFRQWKPAAALLLPTLLFISFYNPYVVPKITLSHTEPELKILTFNVLFSNENYEQIAEVIVSKRPDLVALQEVQPEMMAESQSLISDEYPYSLMGTEHEWGTTAVFSRHPFEDAFVLDLENDRPAVVVRTSINDEPSPLVVRLTHRFNIVLRFFERCQCTNCCDQMNTCTHVVGC